MKNLIGYLLIALFAIGAVKFLTAAQGKQARVTQVVQDVRLLTTRTGSRPAAVNDTVTENTAVRTGGGSRAELTFVDQTLARIGANTVFSFGDGAKQFDLASGAMLLAVPKSAGTVRVNTAGATAAISGFTALFESHKNTWSKFIVLEGQACVRYRYTELSRKRQDADCIILNAGEMVLYKDGKFTGKKTVDLAKLIATAGLIEKFRKLPPWSWDPIQAAIDDQESNPPPGGFYDLTGIDPTDQKNVAPPMPTPRMMRPPSSPPGKF